MEVKIVDYLRCMHGELAHVEVMENFRSPDTNSILSQSSPVTLAIHDDVVVDHTAVT